MPSGIAIAEPAAADALSGELQRAFARLPEGRVPSGILLDRVVAMSRMERFDGTASAPPARPADVRQIVHELERASLAGWSGPDASTLRERARAIADGGVVPIAVVDARVHRIRDGAREEGAVRIVDGRVDPSPAALEELRVFAAAALVGDTRRAAAVSFAVPRELWLAAARPPPSRLWLDLEDGRGLLEVRFGEPVRPAWTRPGRRELRLRAEWPDGEARTARFSFDAVRMQTPAPHDTLVVNAAVPYEGVAGSGRAYVYLAEGHAAPENPAVVVEGFDLDDSMDWETLYELLNQENLLEDLRAAGLDAVVLDFDSATDPIQRNAYVVAELLQQVGAMADPAQGTFLVGASMGGLCARYALLWLESQAIDAHVRTFLSFDAPHAGADIPLGLQYWLDFFADLSADAAYLLGRLDTPAARQLLVYHHTSPPGATGQADPLRGALVADLAALGDWPSGVRRIAAANGSGAAVSQGFSPAEQIVRYEYRSALVDIDGNVWAVPDGAAAQVFRGEIDFILLPPDSITVVVSGTSPYDGAPGGNRDSMFQMDTTAAPYGDIVALHDRHCFIPTVSALALPAGDLFLDVGGTPDVLSMTPFAAARWAAGNEPHVSVAPDTKAWILAEALAGPTGAAAVAAVPRAELLSLRPASPNPSRGDVALRFALARPAAVTLEVFDVAGRRVARLLASDPLASGEHAVRWTPAAPGVYFYRLRGEGQAAAGRVTALE
jgi:hypothetical protein